MRLMVTGGAGFIGANFVRYWSQHHPDDHLVVYDLLTYAGNLANLEGIVAAGNFIQGDIADTAAVLAAMDDHQVEVVVNFAAESHNSLAVIDPGRFFRTNVVGTQGLCEAARHHGVSRFHHVSTCEVYGDLDLDSPELFTEESPYRPRTPYNASKAGGDHVVRAYYETFSLPITITNCANNYGPYQFPEKVIPLFCALALSGQALPVYQSADNRREWIHVDDHCRAIDLVLSRGRVGETYHVGTGVEASVTDIADRVLAGLGCDPGRRVTVPDRPGHDRRYALDWTRIHTQLGWSPTIEFDPGMAATIEWYAQNRSWWEPLLDRAPVSERTAWSSSGSTGADAPSRAGRS
ncbi:MAG: dTDP-glucose 4,6-dehydratase [Acidimicrobiales bacterium]